MVISKNVNNTINNIKLIQVNKSKDFNIKKDVINKDKTKDCLKEILTKLNIAFSLANEYLSKKPNIENVPISEDAKEA